MENVRELVGALTQARVQMIAAQAVIEATAAGLDNADALGGDDGENAKELQALRLDAQKLSRCMGVVADVRDRYARPGVREVAPAKDGGA